MENTNLLIIGAGPGGYAAAFLAADLGLNVTLIDKEKNPGGVCSYRGCIPSKALLHVSKLINESKESSHWGIEFQSPKIDVDKLRSWKDGVVSKLTGGLGQLTKARKINYIQGTAEFINSNSVEVVKVDGTKTTLTFDKAIIATGSSPLKVPSLSLNSPRLLDSTSALDIQNIPETLLVVGGGYIGLELGTVYNALGSKVSVVEMTPGLLPGADRDLVNILSKNITSKFHSIMLNTKVVEMKEEKKGIKVKFESPDGSFKEEIFEKVLVSIGRVPNSKGFGLENTKVIIDNKGFIEVDKQLRTNDPNIFAIGDVVGNPMLAHKASAEAKVAVEVIMGGKSIFAPHVIPAVVFTDPEIAWAGITETEAKEKGIIHEVTRFPWAAIGRAVAMDRTDGLTKLIIDPETQRILGIGIVGVGAGEMISEGTLAIEMAANAEDLKLTIHPHPTLSETIMESAEMFFGHATSIYRPKKK